MSDHASNLKAAAKAANKLAKFDTKAVAVVEKVKTAKANFLASLPEEVAALLSE